MRYRDERLSVTIRELLAQRILREFEFPNTLVTITEVELTPKRDAATVLISVLPDAQAPLVLRRLSGAAGMLKHFLLKSLRIRIVPDLFFKLDKGPQNAAAVEKAFSEVVLSDEDEER